LTESMDLFSVVISGFSKTVKLLRFRLEQFDRVLICIIQA
jgi:hypothetical protein